MQVQEWAAYNQLEPVGAYRRDYMEAQILAMIQNIAQSVYSKKGATPKTAGPLDFIPWSDGLTSAGTAPPTGAQTPEEIKQLFLNLKKQTRQTRGTKTPLQGAALSPAVEPHSTKELTDG